MLSSKKLQMAPESPTATVANVTYAQKAGADWAAWGTVQKVSNLILNINLYMEDEPHRSVAVREERRHTGQHRRDLASWSRLLTSELSISATLRGFAGALAQIRIFASAAAPRRHARQYWPKIAFAICGTVAHLQQTRSATSSKTKRGDRLVLGVLKMNKFLLGTALVALGTLSAQAADLAVRRAPASYPP